MEKKVTSVEQLFDAAKSAADNAYAPYSKFRVGAAVECSDGQLVAGCNVENASYGLTICAERNAIAAAVAQGHQNFERIVIYTPLKQFVPPCGACRQVIAEFLPKQAEVVLMNGEGKQKQYTVEQMLPAAFEPESLERD